MRIAFIMAECYANYCFAQYILQFSVLRSYVGGTPTHKHEYGRDELLRLAKKNVADGRVREGEIQLLVIDYEESERARRVIENHFDMHNATKIGTAPIYLALSNRLRSIAIVFDSNIEEFLCRVTGRYCDDYSRESIKHGDAERVCRILQKDFEDIQGVFHEVVKKLKNVLSELR